MRPTAPIIVLACLVSSSAAAEPGKVFGQEVVEVEPLTDEEVVERRAGFQQMLDEKGWVQIDDQVRPAAIDGSFAQEPPPPLLQSGNPHRSTIYLNFLGLEGMSPGTNAAEDQSSCLQASMDWPGFVGNNDQAFALIDVFERNMEPYGVRIAYDVRPPKHLPYAMVMMGGLPSMLGLGGGVLGVSCSSDCADMWWRDTTFAFTDAINPNNADVLGTTALHEAAHAFGLAHIDDPTKIMNPFVSAGEVIWADECTPYNDATGGINCQGTHASFCDGQPAQNTHAELMAYFGPNSPDITPPEVTITGPEDGVQLAPGEAFTVTVDVSDDHDGFGWQLVVPELEQSVPAYTFEKEWTLSFPDDGEYTILVEAIDHDMNEGSDQITIFVGSAGPGDDGGGVDEGGSDDGADASGDDDDDDDDDDDSGDGTGDGGADGGVDDRGCRVGGETPERATWALLGFVPLMLRRRD